MAPCDILIFAADVPHRDRICLNDGDNAVKQIACRFPAWKQGVDLAVNEKSKVAAILVYTLLTALILHTKFPGAVDNALVSDLVTVFLFSAVIALIVHRSLKINKLSELAIFLPAALVMVFLIRAIPNIILGYPPLEDPYYHYVCATNVLQYGTIQPHMSWWYYQADMQLTWPMMHILTAQLVEMTGLDAMFFFRFFSPIVGTAFFLGLFTLAYMFTRHFGMALLAGLIGSMGSTVIFYQSEYHPQGLALVFFVFILYGFLKTRERYDVPFIIMSSLFILSFILTHHFSTLFLALVFLVFIALGLVANKIPLLKDMFGFLSKDVRFLLPISIIVLIFSIYTNPDMVELLLNWTINLKPVSGLSTAPQVTTPLLTVILNFSKWIPILIVLLTVPFILNGKDKNLKRLLVIVTLIFVIGALGLFLIFLPLDRLLAFSMPIVAVICSITVLRLVRPKIYPRKVALTLCTIAIIFAIVAGMLASQMPAYFFKSSGTDPYYWYGNDLPDAVDTGMAGQWSIENIERNRTYGVSFSTWSIPFYYGKNPNMNIGGIDDRDHYDYVVVNKNNYYDAKKSLNSIEAEANKIYSGPNIVYYSYPSASSQIL
ncbi:glycosyltransferase family protein [Methanomassiliicoccus luminyensis]|uniref:hypothetical protein n=1 Tax=Methanomassiliicoccus luminyensis TaxID=1080712 RepID=UPI0003760AD9|nr:hypothetical protein [Methanomassiliicoccus luminyensis]